MIRASLIGALATSALVGSTAGDARAACPPGTKEAVGTCVTACPAGYEDEGYIRLSRNMSH